jgi:hypothetical protein
VFSLALGLIKELNLHRIVLTTLQFSKHSPPCIN